MFTPILESLADAVIITDPEEHITFFNPTAERLTGWKHDNACGKAVSDVLRLVGPADETPGDRVQDQISPARTGGGALVYQVSSLAGNKVVHYLALPLWDSAGNVVGKCTILRDITDQVEMDDALRERDARFQTLAEAMPLFVWQTDAEGRPEYASAKWYAVTGMPPEKIQAEGWTAIHHPEDVPRLRAAWQHAIRKGVPYEAESRVRSHSASEYRWFRCLGAPVRNSEGHVVKWVGTFSDIEGQHQGEDTRKEADSRKDEFLAMLGHELRNPLAPIHHGLEVLKCLPCDPRAAELHQMMERQVDHLVRLVDDLLDVSRIMRGRIELRREEVLLSLCINRAVETVAPLLESQRHKFTLELPSEPVVLYGDPVRLSQIFSNLLGNAAKYTPEGGHIELHAETRADQVIVRVRDNGVGIQEDMLPAVFDLFVQSKCSLARSQGGLGIGLTLVRRLVEMHGGTVNAKSSGLGQGSEFVVRLPTSRGSGATAKASVPPSNFVRRRVLVIDDNEDGANSLASLLTLWGHEVHTLFEGRDAIETARTFRPDIVLLDLGLPGISGYEVATAFRTDPEVSNVVLVAMSGYGQAEDRRRTQEAGFCCHLVKPVNTAKLRDVVESLGVSAARSA